MTICTPVIKRFANRGFVALSGGQQVQVLPSISWLPKCQKYQGAAFIADRGMLVVWNDDPTAVIDQASKMERELLTMMWQAESELDLEREDKKGGVSVTVTAVPSRMTSRMNTATNTAVNTAANSANASAEDLGEVEADGLEPVSETMKKVNLTLPVIEAIAIGALTSAMGSLIQHLVVESAWDGGYIRFALVVVIPLLCFLSLFFFQAIAADFMQLFGPIKQLQENSKFYSGVRPQRLSRHRDDGLPHVTIQMPVYKEGLDAVIVPTIRSIKAAIATYEMQGGTANM